MMDSLLYKILKNRTEAEISASGNPATLPGTLKNNPMNEMKVFGWSKQDGDPTPENPVEIESAGMKWSTGAQLYDMDTRLNVDGVEYEKMEHLIQSIL